MRALFILISLSISLLIFSQQPQGGGKKGGNGVKGEIFGNVVDSLSSEAIPYATVMVIRQADGTTAGGVVTSDNGSFSIPDLPAGKYDLKISFVGYTTKFVRGAELSENQTTYQLKDFSLAPTTLETVDVYGGKPDITYEIDKKVVNVENMQNTDGQTAVEILANIPSITVNSDGSISLRGSSSFTLLIDGVPTILDPSDALATIPASTIQDIEIITNPSAKFDAEGTSGVINIITKKSKLQGISCLANATAGRFDNYSADVALNVRKKNVTFDITANFNQRTRPSDETYRRVTTYDSLVNTLKSTGYGDHKRRSWGGTAGFQWNPNNSHNLVINSDFTSTLMQFINESNFENYDDDSLISAFFTDAHPHIDIIGSSSSLFYQYNIKRDKKHYIIFKAIANLRYVTQNDSTTSFDENNQIIAGNIYTETGPSNMFRFNLDYALPFKNGNKFETGLQSQLGKSADIGRNYTYNLNTQDYDLNPLFSSDVDYIRDVHAAYAIFGGKHKKIGYQAGLRAEYTYRTISSTSAIAFTTINRLDWFPSTHFSYGFDNKSQILLSYSRRIERPRSWFFEPFITWESPYSVRTGNPNLQPEYINAFELSFMQPLKKKGFYSFEGYYRTNSNVINRISSVYQEGILINQPYNIGTSQSYGLEGSVNYSITDWYKVNAGFNTFIYNLSGSLNDVDYSAQSFNWNVRLTNSFDFKGWMLQFVSRYESGSVTAQGTSNGFFSQDVSLKKSFFKNKFSFNLQGRNILATEKRESFSYTENVEIYDLRKPLAPQITLTLSMKLNNYEKVQNRGEDLDDF